MQTLSAQPRLEFRWFSPLGTGAAHFLLYGAGRSLALGVKWTIYKHIL